MSGQLKNSSRERKRICYIVTLHTVIQTFFIPQLIKLVEAGYNVSVICSNAEELEKDLQDINCIPLEISRGIHPISLIKSIVKLYAILKKEQYDFVQYSTPNGAFVGAIASYLAGVPVRNYHCMGFRYLGAHGLGRIILKSLERITCFFSTSIECVSNSNLKLGIQEKLFPENKATVVWNGSTGGVDLNRFDYKKRSEWRNEIRSELSIPENSFVYAFVGRITRDKGINELLSAFFSINVQDSYLLLLGDIENEQYLDKRLMNKARECHNIIFHKRVIDVERYYAAIDVLLLPSYREGFGNVVIEAGAMGTPSIVTNIPGPIDAVIANETAYVVPVKNIEELARSMIRIRSNYKRMGNKAREYASNCFDSNELCIKILQQKMYYLKED